MFICIEKKTQVHGGHKRVKSLNIMGREGKTARGGVRANRDSTASNVDTGYTTEID